MKTFLRLFIVFTIITLGFNSNATIINVPGDSTTIQGGINGAVNGDTVLVQVGTYFENINFNGKNIIVGSMFLTTGNKNYITQTIINGSSSGNVVIFEGGETSGAMLTGFTITGGSGATISPYNNGGGIYISNSGPFLNNLIISNNNANAGNGGGIYIYQYQITGNYTKISKCILNLNTAITGGGIYIAGTNQYSPIIENTIINGNLAFTNGGGVYLHHYGTLTGCLVSNNYAGNEAGGVYSDSASIGGYIYNSTVTFNNAPANGGMSYIYSGPTVQNSIVFYNDNGNYNGGFFTYSCSTPLPAGTGNISSDPLFVDTVNGDFQLQAASPCINGGDTSGLSLPAFDLLGNPRIISTAVDMGAFEFNGCPNIILQPVNQFECIGNSASFMVYASGQSLSYQWQKDGTDIIGATDSIIVINPFGYADTGYYKCVVFNSCDTITSDSAYLDLVPAPVVNLGNDTTLCGGAGLTLDAGPGFVAYLWHNGFQTQTFLADSTGTYIVNVLDFCGNVGVDTINIIFITPPTSNLGADTTLCYLDTIVLSVPAIYYTYQWNLNGNPISSAVGPSYIVTGPGAYTIEIEDICSSLYTSPPINIGYYGAINSWAGPDTSICLGQCVTLNVSGGVAYYWSTGGISDSINVCPFGTTTYSVMVYDSNGCFVSEVISVNSYQLPAVSISGYSSTYCPGSTPDTLIGTPAGGIFTGTGLVSGNVFDPILAGIGSHTLTYTYTDINGCVGVGYANLSVGSGTSANITATGLTTFCQGDSVYLYANVAAGSSYEWYRDSVLIPGETMFVYLAKLSGKYTVKLTDSVGCYAFSAPINVMVYSIPDVNLGPDTIICFYDTVVLDAGAGYNNYLWSNGTTNQIMYATGKIADIGPKVISVIVTKNGCVTMDDITITFDPCTGIEEEGDDFDISLYPNPNNGNFTVNFDNNQTGDFLLRIYDIYGREIKTFFLYKSDITYTKVLHLNMLQSGVYILSLEFEKSRIVRLFIVR